MAVNRILDTQEGDRYTEITERVILNRPPSVNMPFGNFLNAIQQLDLTKVEINRDAQTSVELLFRNICPTCPTTSVTGYTVFFLAYDADSSIWAANKTGLTGLTTVLTGTSYSVSLTDMKAHYPTRTLFWLTDTNGSSQKGRLLKATYTASNGTLSSVTTVLKFSGTSYARGLELDLNSSGVGWVYYSDSSQRVYKIHPDGTSKTVVKAGLSNPAGLWLSNTTVLWVALTGVGDLVKLHLNDSSVTSLVGGNTDHYWVDGDFAQGYVFYKRDANIVLRRNNIAFTAESPTFLNCGTGAVQAPIVDEVDQKVYVLIGQAGNDAVKKLDYDGSNITTVGTFTPPVTVFGPWCLG